MTMQEKIDMLVEIWRDINGYEGLYQCSNWGRIKSLARRRNKYKEKLLKLRIDTKRYLYVSLCKNGTIKNFRVHRLVLETFIGPCPLGMECRHLDGNRQNNWIENIKWGTRKENRADTKKHGTFNPPPRNDSRGERCGTSKLNEKQVRIIKWLFKNSDMTNKEIGEIFGVHYVTIWDIRNNITWRHVGIAGDNNV